MARPRLPLVVVALLLGAVAVGAAASVLLTAPSTHPTTPGEPAGAPPSALIAWAIVALFFAAVVLLVVHRFTAGNAFFPTRIIVTVVIGLVVLSGFVFLFHYLDGGWQGFEGPAPVATPGNNSTGTTPIGNTTSVSNATGGAVPFFHFAVPGWVPVTVLLVIAVIVAVFAAPPLAERLQEMREARGRSADERLRAGAARTALAAAGRALDAGADPRLVIQQLYAQLLARISPLVGGVAAETPEEIRIAHLRSLGIRESSASALTRLFEEARYSTHLMSAEAADRARTAIAAAGEDLDRRAGPR